MLSQYLGLQCSTDTLCVAAVPDVPAVSEVPAVLDILILSAVVVPSGCHTLQNET